MPAVLLCLPHPHVKSVLDSIVEYVLRCVQDRVNTYNEGWPFLFWPNQTLTLPQSVAHVSKALIPVRMPVQFGELCFSTR